MEIVQELKEWQREYLSPFCLDECLDTCCCREETRILMTEEQLRKTYGIKAGKRIPLNENYYLDGYKKDNSALYWVAIHPAAEHPHCPAYNPETKTCLLEDDKPAGCRNFPLWIESPLIYLSKKCDIVRTDNAVVRRLEKIAKENSHKIRLISSPSQIKRHNSYPVLQA
jgi:Fe-S-cluster containining protein